MGVIAFKKVKTRKPHKCWGCMIDIPIGIEVNRTTNIDGGNIGTAYWCPDCDNLWNKLSIYEQSGGFCYGEFIEYCRDMGYTEQPNKE